VSDTQLRQLAENHQMDEEWRQSVKDYLSFVDVTESQYRDERTPLAIQEEIANGFRVLMTSSDLPVPWGDIWEKRFERRYGPLDWTPPAIPPVMMEDGSQNPNAWRPYVRKIVDGDTLIVSENPGPTLLGGERGETKMRSIRLLGVMARELHDDGGQEDRDRLVDTLQTALESGEPIWLVRDPETYGTNTDQYGRELAYLYVGETPFYFEEDFNRALTPSGGEN